MKTIQNTHQERRLSKRILEMNMLISILKNKTVQIGDGLKNRYFKRIDEIKKDIKAIKSVR